MQQDVAQDLSKSDRQTAVADQRPIALGAVSEASGTPAWKTVKTCSVVGTQDKVLPPATQMQEAKRANATVTRVNGSNLSLISKSHQVVQVIETASR